MRMEGGRLYGEGFKGETFDAAASPIPKAPRRRSGTRVDNATLVAALTRLRHRLHDGAVVLHGPHVRRSTLVLPASPATLDRLAGLVARTGAGLVAKRFKRAGAVGRADFERELSLGARVATAYEAVAGRGASARWTTLGSSLCWPSQSRRFHFAGIEVRTDEGQGQAHLYVLSRRCAAAVSAVIFDDASLRRFLAETTESLRLLHAGGWVHGDVKLANMVECGGGSGARFRLIDWELAVSAAELRRGRFVTKNFASPMFWYCWGMPVALAAATSVAWCVKNAPSCASGRRALSADGAEYHASIGAAVVAFQAHMAGPGVRDLSRAALMRRHWHTFDGFNVGVMALGVIVDRKRHPALTDAGRAEALAIVKRLLAFE
jgi:hypothetical protein